MKRPERERLLRDVLSDENVERLREASLAQGLAALGRRRRQRTVLATLAASLAFAMIALVVTQRPRPTSVVTATAAPLNTTKISVISDDQLLALFADRAVALVGTPGAQQLIILDAAERTTLPEKAGKQTALQRVN